MGKVKENIMNAAGAYSYITITSDSRVMIEGCTQIIECSEVLARIVTRQFIVEVWGSDLRMNCFSNSSAEVEGRITSVSLERKRSGDSI